MKTLLILSAVALASCNQVFKLGAVWANSGHQNRISLSHASIAVQQYHEQKKVKRHSLQHESSSYEQNILETDHYGFLLPLTIDGIQYKMSMDTGSSDIFIKGENAPGVPEIKYKSGEDFERKPVIKIGYLDGDLKTYEKTLNIQFNNKTIETPLLVAYTAGKQFEGIQGLIGLSYPSIARHQPTFIQTLIKNNIISKYAYGMNLNLIQDNRSFISFGAPDPELFEGNLTEYPISNQGESKSISVKFSYAAFGSGKKMKIANALLDTGNTCISIPRKFQKEMLKQFNTKSNKCYFMVEQNINMFSILMCKIDNFDELPILKLSFDGQQTYEIQKQFYLQRCTKKQSKSSSFYCETYIESVSQSRIERIFLGDAFFNRFYTYFDLEQEKVGIAKNRENITLDTILSLKLAYNPQDWLPFRK